MKSRRPRQNYLDSYLLREGPIRMNSNSYLLLTARIRIGRHSWAKDSPASKLNFTIVALNLVRKICEKSTYVPRLSLAIL